MGDEMRMPPEVYTKHVLKRQGLHSESYESSPMGSSLLDSKMGRTQDDSKMGAEDYARYVMRRHGLTNDVPSSPLSSALVKRKEQFQGDMIPGGPELAWPEDSKGGEGDEDPRGEMKCSIRTTSMAMASLTKTNTGPSHRNWRKIPQ